MDLTCFVRFLLLLVGYSSSNRLVEAKCCFQSGYWMAPAYWLPRPRHPVLLIDVVSKTRFVAGMDTFLASFIFYPLEDGIFMKLAWGLQDAKRMFLGSFAISIVKISFLRIQITTVLLVWSFSRLIFILSKFAELWLALCLGNFLDETFGNMECPEPWLGTVPESESEIWLEPELVPDSWHGISKSLLLKAEAKSTSCPSVCMPREIAASSETARANSTLRRPFFLKWKLCLAAPQEPWLPKECLLETSQRLGLRIPSHWRCRHVWACRRWSLDSSWI